MLSFFLKRRLLSYQHGAKYNAEYIVLKKFTQEELNKFSALTGDFNNIHTTSVPIDQRKVHGAFLNAIVSAIIGTQFPGPGTVVLEQSFRFPKACRINVDTTILLRLHNPRKISTITYECKQNDNVVFLGEARVLLKL